MLFHYGGVKIYDFREGKVVMQIHLSSKVRSIGRQYLNWLSKSSWRCIIGLYATGVIGTFALWGGCKVIVIFLAWVISL